MFVAGGALLIFDIARNSRVSLGYGRSLVTIPCSTARQN
jgi:hypothetical protein